MGVEPGAAASSEHVAATGPHDTGTATDVERDADDGGDSRTGASDTLDEPPHEAPRGTALDAWWAQMLSTPRRRALWYWGGPVVVTLIAAVLRFWGLGHPQSIVFDETYYVKDAWTLLQNGYESSWPENADAEFANGDTSIFLDDPAYVVHPPLGKWMISLGMAAFGAGDAFWWRVMTALAGTIAVFLVAMVARRLFSSTV